MDLETLRYACTTLRTFGRRARDATPRVTWRADAARGADAVGNLAVGVTRDRRACSRRGPGAGEGTFVRARETGARSDTRRTMGATTTTTDARA